MASSLFLQQAYLAYFGRPVDATAVVSYANVSEATVIANFSSSAESKALYPTFGLAQINAIYQTLFGRDAELAGANYHLNTIANGTQTPASMALAILKGALNADITAVNNKLAASAAFTANLDTTAEALGYAGDASAASARAFLSTVTDKVVADSAAITAAVVKAVAASSTTATATSSFTVGQDTLNGTSVADIFKAMVVQNSAGAQTNQLATGDQINGGAGVDTLSAIVQKASALGGTATQAITPITTSVEKANFTALTVGQNGVVAPEIVVINAKSMTGLTNVGSVQSDASLVIQNLTTLTDTGAYADRLNTDSITIRMDHSGNDKALDAASNLTVLFDNDYLKADSSNTGSLELRAVNVLALKDKALPLFGFTSVSFKVGTVTVTAPLTDAIRALSGQPAYDAVVVAINTAIAAAGITNVTAALGTVRTAFFSDDAGGYLAQSLAGNYFPILVTASKSQVLATGVIALDSSVVSANYLNTEILGGVSTAFAPVTSNIELNKVGRGAEGGSLIVGGMATAFANTWDYSATALKEGVEKFVITVSGDTTQMSSLSNLSSTNNTLQIVEVGFAKDEMADLIIGNHNTGVALPNGANNVVDGVANVSSSQNLALKDVRVFTATTNNNPASVNGATALTNDVTLNAYLSDEVVAKYMNRADNVANAATDNAAFAYTTSSGNDSLNLNISKSNLAASGTTAREDFTLKIDAGAGNNTVVTQIGDGKGTTAGNADAWYVNQTIQKNLSITAGAGNDVVKTNGAGTWAIDTGAGNDAIYSDNSGRQVINANTAAAAESNAVWVFNSTNQIQTHVALTAEQPLYNLTSAGAVAATATKIANLQLTVSYRGINAIVPVGDTVFAAGASVDDLSINQAIKAAINDNVYLKNLLSAQDGTGRTLVVTSLTDGVFSDADISISLANPTPLTGAQTAAGAAYITAAQLSALGFTATGASVVAGRFDSAIAEDALGASIVGAVSTQRSASAITAGAGTDTVVLTTGTSAETVNVNDGAADVVFNAGAGSTITVDILDTVVTSNGIVIFGGVGSVAVIDTGVTGTELNDTINASASTAITKQSISGLAGNDTITGSLFGNTITGDAGSDVINFAIGTGADTLAFNSLVGADTIANYTVANDDITVSKAVFTGVGAIGALTAAEFESGAGLVAAATAAGRFVYNTTTGALFYDADGSAATAPVLVATFTGIPTLASGEFSIVA